MIRNDLLIKVYILIQACHAMRLYNLNNTQFQLSSYMFESCFLI